MVRLGVFGNLSFTISTIAKTVKMIAAGNVLIKVRWEPRIPRPRRWITQLVTAGAVSERRPAITPIPKHRAKSSVAELMIEDSPCVRMRKSLARRTSVASQGCS